MALSDLPRVVFSHGPDLPVPEGFVTSPELLEYIFFAWWGGDLINERSEWSAPFFYTVEIEPKGRIASAISSGQLSECAELIRNACFERDLHGFVPKDRADPAGERVRLKPVDWQYGSFFGIESELMVGNVARFVNEHLSWANQCPFLFSENEADTWIRGLVSPHVMPEPLTRDPSGLPDRAHVFLCEVVTWLSDGAATSKDRAQAEAIIAMDLASGIESDADARFFEEHFPEVSEPTDRDRWMATSAARDRRRAIALSAVNDVVVSSDLEAFGVFGQLPGSGVRPQRISPDLFLSDVGLCWIKDALEATGSSEDHERYREARAQGTWTDLRFRKADVVAMWGNGPSAHVQAPPTRKVRGPSYDWEGAKAEYRRLMEHHGPLSADDPFWSKQKDIENAILDWFMKTWGIQPDVSGVRRHINFWKD